VQVAPSFVRSVAGLVAGLLVACGGGSSDLADPPADPGPAAISFQLMPARLPLGAGTAGQLLPLQAPGTLVWSSSDPAVASVDATAGSPRSPPAAR
jgi:hypothetical protein